VNIFQQSFLTTFDVVYQRQECIDELKYLYGGEAPSYSTVENWFNEFNRGRHSFKDEGREGRPKISSCATDH